jgi:hypothetical protein
MPHKNPHFSVNKSEHPCYMGVFAQANHSKHANGMLYLLGQHYSFAGDLTTNDILMENFYPQIVRNFLRGQKPSESKLYT